MSKTAMDRLAEVDAKIEATGDRLMKLYADRRDVIYQMYCEQGGTRTAEALGVSRQAVYNTLQDRKRRSELPVRFK
jgi:hypothetical protein